MGRLNDMLRAQTHHADSGYPLGRVPSPLRGSLPCRPRMPRLDATSLLRRDHPVNMQSGQGQLMGPIARQMSVHGCVIGRAERAKRATDSSTRWVTRRRIPSCGIEAVPPRLNARMAGSIGHIHVSRGVRAPKLEKRYTTPRSGFRFALKPVTVARPRWNYTSFHES
jgi:hypothetical protein